MNTIYYRGCLWREIKPNPLVWWKRLIGRVMYVNDSGETFESWSAAEGQW